MIRPLCLAFCLLATSLSAQNSETGTNAAGLPYAAPGRGITDHVALRERALKVLERQYGRFSDAARGLEQAARDYCEGDGTQEALQAQFAETWRAWAPLDTYQFGPVEANAAVLTVNFWPDKKGFVGRGLRTLLAADEEQQADPAFVAEGSAAMQGLPALEMLLFTDTGPECPAVIGISGSLLNLSKLLYDDWFAPGGWAELVRSAGPDNPVYLSDEEFTKTLYTALDFGLIRVAGQRLGRPLGTYERSFPRRAEAWRSGLTNDIVKAQLAGIAEMLRDGLAGDIREPDRAWVLTLFTQAEARVDRIGLPVAEAVKEPNTRIRVEALRDKVDALRRAFAEDIGPALGVDTGFSPADGD